MRAIAMLILLFGAAAPGAELTDAQRARAEALERRLMAPCCWSETVAEHRSEIALQMRAEIEQMVAEGKNDREILDHYKAQYGMRILTEPEGGLFWVMNVAPVVVLIFGMAVVVILIRRWAKARPPETADANS